MTAAPPGRPSTRACARISCPTSSPKSASASTTWLAHPRHRETLYQQNHCGIYRAGLGRAGVWTDISDGLPSRFGFGLAVPADEPETLFTVPIEAAEYRCTPEGKFRVARSRDDRGDLGVVDTRPGPQRDAHLLVLREGMAADALCAAGVYAGTTGGQIFHTRDAGESWSAMAEYLPGVISVAVAS